MGSQAKHLNIGVVVLEASVYVAAHKALTPPRFLFFCGNGSGGSDSLFLCFTSPPYFSFGATPPRKR